MTNRRLFPCLVLIASIAGGCKHAETSTPEATVKGFAAAVGAGDFKTAARFVKGARPDADFSEMAKRFKGQEFKLEVTTFKSKDEGDKATATFELQVVGGSGQRQSIGADSCRLERVGGTWLITPPESGAGMSPLGHLATMVASPVQFVALGEASANAASCLVNVKELCLGFLMLAVDKGDVFKAKASDWAKSIAPYVKKQKSFHCPDDKSGGVSYSVNPNVLGKSTAGFPRPAETVLVYEGRNTKLDFRHSGRAMVGFVDGHVQAIDAEQAKTLRWKP